MERAIRWIERVPASVIVVGFYAFSFGAYEVRSAAAVASALVAFALYIAWAIARESFRWDILLAATLPFSMSRLLDDWFDVPDWLPFAFFPVALMLAIWRERFWDQDDDGPDVRAA